MNFPRYFFPLVALSLMLVSFSDCNHGEKKSSTTDSDPSANAKQPAQDAPVNDEPAPVNDQQTKEPPQDTAGSKTSAQQNGPDEMPRKGPPPRPLEPRWTGGNHEAIQAFFKKHVKYPEEARKNNIKGTVHVMFTVKATGEAEDFKVRKGLGYGCDEEAVRVIKLLGKWQPGKMGGKEVYMEYSLGVPFGE